MTREEALTDIKERVHVTEYVDSSYVDCVDIEALRLAIKALEQQESTRTFVELVVEYPDPEWCVYKEYKGKPYYAIKYIENGEEYVGYGTYNLKVLSQYLKEYFMPYAQLIAIAPPDKIKDAKPKFHPEDWREIL